MTVRTWLRSAALVVAGVMVAVVMVAPPAYSKPKKKEDLPLLPRQ